MVSQNVWPSGLGFCACRQGVLPASGGLRLSSKAVNLEQGKKEKCSMLQVRAHHLSRHKQSAVRWVVATCPIASHPSITPKVSANKLSGCSFPKQDTTCQRQQKRLLVSLQSRESPLCLEFLYFSPYFCIFFFLFSSHSLPPSFPRGRCRSSSSQRQNFNSRRLDPIQNWPKHTELPCHSLLSSPCHLAARTN